MRFHVVIAIAIIYVCVSMIMVLITEAVTVKYLSKPEDCDSKKKIEEKDYVTFHYRGRIDESSKAGEKGKIFDDSKDKGPVVVQMKKDSGIEGFKGLLGVCVGAKVSLTIPPEEAYGDHGVGNIVPPGATLRFDIQVIEASKKPPADQPNVFAQIDKNGDKRISKQEALDFFKKSGLDEVPAHVWKEDVNGDGYISWDEFTGPKGEEGMGIEVKESSSKSKAGTKDTEKEL